ncbi:High affinity Ca2+/Mn2+ P-type ATPase-like protein [Blyttiomyces sp. JEL0837]|nr:High affinity Ca2+/Mn2+ P-type ATPase-like protein [Blyttiomyces sp. JEL0837]
MSYTPVPQRDSPASRSRDFPPQPVSWLHDSYAGTGVSALFATKTIEETAQTQHTNIQSGISDDEASYRRRLAGPNDFGDDEEESMLSKFVDQFKNPLIVLLLASALVSLLMGQVDDAVSITLAIVIVVTVAFVQEYRSEQSLKALNKLVPHSANVIRNSSTRKIPASDLVPGDVVQFGTGDRVPADVRLATSIDLEIDESSLTGENKPCRKTASPVEGVSDDLSLAERKNIAFMGTLVRHGHGTGVVIGTGKHTEFGHVFSMMKEVETRKTPLQISMDLLGKQLSIMSFGVIVLIMLIGVYQGREMLEMFTIGVSLAVAAIPEGLPIVVTVTLALGVLRMAKRHTIVKKLPSVESLGSVNVICADKTGTLTLNSMAITKVFTFALQAVQDVEKLLASNARNSDAMHMLCLVGTLCNNASVDENVRGIGQPTEVAIIEFAHKGKFGDSRENYTRISEVPFSSDRKCMTVVCKRKTGSEKPLYYVKGSSDSVLEKCTKYFMSNDDIRVLDSATRELVLSNVHEVSKHGLRCLFMAYGEDENNLVLVGFVAMHDPPRPGVSDCIGKLVSSGVRVVMITGDSETTAAAIARELGIPANPDGKNALSGTEIDSLRENVLDEMVEGVSVFYRTSPRHKLAIVRAFQAKGYIVAMTGDGVNDAPALRLADIGISMGRSGTDVAKEAADMILVNDDFNIICDGPVAQSLGVEAVDPDVMAKPPRSKNASIITKPFLIRMLFSAVFVVLGTLYIYSKELVMSESLEHGTTMVWMKSLN